MNRFVCIHGHFYQPPRENAWLEAVESQDSAHPYHNWNERITAECYAPNHASRILDEEGRIVSIVNNYARMSVNFGPTLLAWLEWAAPGVYQGILNADAESRQRFSGHGSALAQAYNHMIMPLANRRDKETQILWGIRDFEARFRRRPEGIWLPETAVDVETLEILADSGIRFTILSPYQAEKVRPAPEAPWQDVSGGRIVTTRPYRHPLPGGRSIALFFYDGPISRAVAFEGLLEKGETFARRLMDGFTEEDAPQLVHIATDGETYGHHHRHGEMALSYALTYIESRQLARITNYGEFLAAHPPAWEVAIHDNSSWSCAHGVERWQSDCGCAIGHRPGWNQKWRRPLRQALNQLRDSLQGPFEAKAKPLLKNPWQARNDYIEVILDRSVATVAAFLKRHARTPLEWSEEIEVLKLMELQRQAMLMYTSCGWFFDEISGLEATQVIQYAGRAIQLGKELFQKDLETPFLGILAQARSNLPQHRNGRVIYEKWIRPAVVDLLKVGAHYSVSSLFEAYGDRTNIFCYTAEREDYASADLGRARLVVGRVAITSEITWEHARFHFSALHLGDHNLSCGLLRHAGKDEYPRMADTLFASFKTADFTGTLRHMENFFPDHLFSLKSLFRDEQRKIVGLILKSALKDAEALYRHLFETQLPLMRFLKGSGAPPPRVFYTAGELVLNADLQKMLAQGELESERILALLEEADLSGIGLDADTLEFAFRRRLEQHAARLGDAPDPLDALARLEKACRLIGAFPFEIDLHDVQNRVFDLSRTMYPAVRDEAAAGGEAQQAWVASFRRICDYLAIYLQDGV